MKGQKSVLLSPALLAGAAIVMILLSCTCPSGIVVPTVPPPTQPPGGGAAPPPPTAKPPTAKPPTAKPPTAKPPTAKPPTAKPPTARPPTAPPPTKPPTVTPLTFTFDPKSGPAGSDVRLYLSAAVQPVTVYYNGQALPKKVLDGGKTLEVTIPGNASGSGYFELQWNGQNVKASQPFTVTPPPAKGDLILEDVFLSTDGRVILRVSQSPSGALSGSFGYRVVAQATNVIVAQGSFAIPSGGQAFWTDYKPGGQVTLAVRIDPGNAIPETNEDNNAMTKTLTPASGAALSADLAVTDIYPDNMPKGKVWVRVTNHGHGTVTNVGITLECTALSTPRPGVYAPSQPVHAKRTIVINLSPGQTAAFDTGVSVDTDSFTYSVTASIQVPFQDPNPANNSYTEPIP
ncbi:MAG: hypothetical protein KKA73_03935 [Chloroflexi bacterium]|nr:hypothetical protein [Chloroflexota bacterium]MBU1746815.1 hypothetical protein [Chloroflexota bacterium]